MPSRKSDGHRIDGGLALEIVPTGIRSGMTFGFDPGGRRKNQSGCYKLSAHRGECAHCRLDRDWLVAGLAQGENGEVFKLTGWTESRCELAAQQRSRNTPSLGPEATDAVETVASSSVIRVEA